MNIPPNLTFSHLALELNDAGGLHYLPGAMERLCAANESSQKTALSADDVACGLICRFYVQWREEGGQKDAALEAIVEQLTARGG